MTPRRLALTVLAVSIWIAQPAPLLAWGEEGHKLVCEIAWRRLEPEGRAFVRRLRAADSEPAGSFADSCHWADRARSSTHRATSEYHYVNVARGAAGFDPERDCPAYDCVTIAIRRFTAYLADEGRAAESRAEALRFVGHFVGDAHQPLHAGYKEDRGGNDILVEWFGERGPAGGEIDLHEVWDHRILLKAGLSHPASVRGLDAEITEEQATAWRGFDFESWMDESYRLAVDVAYERRDDNVLATEYHERALPVVRQRIRQAGVRLAYLIDSIARGTYPPSK